MEGHVKEYTLAIVCPMANEQASAKQFTLDLLNCCTHFKSVIMFVVLDHTCHDETLNIMRALALEISQLRVIWAPENRCVVDAYVRGYREALSSKADWVLEIDAGYSHAPDDLVHFLPHVRPEIDCIFGSRFCPGGSMSNSPFGRRLISRLGSTSSRCLLGVRLSDMTSGYEMFRRETLQAVMNRGIVSRGHFFQTEIKTYCRNTRCVEVPIHYQNASGNIPQSVLRDAVKGLLRLFVLRLKGRL